MHTFDDRVSALVFERFEDIGVERLPKSVKLSSKWVR